MSDIQQPEEKKAPTIWQVLGIGALVGVILGYVFFVSGVAGLISGVFLLFSPVTAIIGAVIGVLLPKTTSKKWTGLWIGAVFGAVLSIPLTFIIFTLNTTWIP